MNKPKEAQKAYRTGKVVSLASLKTVIVAVTHQFRHPLYKKAVNRIRRFAVHNENIELAVGDTVRIEESKPISRSKHYIVKSKIG